MQVRVLTYNIRHGKGLDGRISLGRTAGVITAASADLVALQEVDGYSLRSRFRNQAVVLGRSLGMKPSFGTTIKIAGLPVYGNAILSRLPVRRVSRWILPGKGERRGLIGITADVEGAEISFLTTHLGLSVEARREQVGKIIEVLRAGRQPFILTGDFNCTPEADELAPLFALCRDAAAGLVQPTYPADSPRERIDYILVSSHWTVREVKEIKSKASDHLPVLAVLEPAEEPAAEEGS